MDLVSCENLLFANDREIRFSREHGNERTVDATAGSPLTISVCSRSEY